MRIHMRVLDWNIYPIYIYTCIPLEHVFFFLSCLVVIFFPHVCLQRFGLSSTLHYSFLHHGVICPLYFGRIASALFRGYRFLFFSKGLID